MRFIRAALCLTLLAAAARADDDGKKTQISAAAADAYSTLRKQIYSLPLSSDVTVEQFFVRLGQIDQLDDIMQTAQQIGGTRWLDDQTVQVRLEIPGDIIAKRIEGVARAHEGSLPVPMRTLHRDYDKEFLRRTFAATGTSTAAAAAVRFRPDPSQVAWRAVSDANRRFAIESARRAAADRAIESLTGVKWGRSHLLSDALNVPAVRSALQAWIIDRPLTSIEFRDDLEVRVTLSASAPDLWPVLRAELEKQDPVFHPSTEKEWDELHGLVIKASLPAQGRSVAGANLAQVGPAPIVLPAEMPAWANGAALKAIGVSGPVAKSKLKTARAAEADALTKFRLAISAMPLGGATLGQAASQDPRIEQGVCRALDQAKIEKVVYDAPTPGSVRVEMALEPRAVWREISGR